MAWKRLGRIFETHPAHLWMQTHSSTPIAQPLVGNRFRIFFSTRDAHNQSSITWLDLALGSTPEIISVSGQPALSPGRSGYFDDSGVTLSQIVRWQDTDYLYYIGWNLAAKMPFRNSIGLATAPAGSTEFTRISRAPIIDRSAIDPISLSYPWVMVENGLWRMWYGSHTSVEQNGLDAEHVLKYAESDDGIHWDVRGHVCVQLHPGESGVVRPCVVKDPDGYRMWHSVRIGRKETYQMGYATSHDGLTWQRQDALAGLLADPDATAWDHEMICYPYVFDHGGQRYMLYNGNKFGSSGFGLAVWEGALPPIL